MVDQIGTGRTAGIDIDSTWIFALRQIKAPGPRMTDAAAKPVCPPAFRLPWVPAAVLCLAVARRNSPVPRHRARSGGA